MLSKCFAWLPLLAVAWAGTAYSQTINAGGIVNAASYSLSVAPGSVVAIFGQNLATETRVADSIPLPTTLVGTSVLVNGRPIPLFFVSSGQINAQLPVDLPAGTATMSVTAGGTPGPAVQFNVSVSAPGIIVWGQGRAVAANQDYSLNSQDHPAPTGSEITVYLTGQGPVTVPVVTGAASPLNPLARATLTVTATVGGLTAPVSFAGLSPGAVGLFQVNLRIPALASGDFPLVIRVGEAVSNMGLIAVISPDGAPAVVISRTLVYHQLTSLPDNGPDYRTSTVLSGDGGSIAYTYAPGTTKATSPNRIYAMDFTGASPRQVDSYTTQCYCGSIVDISHDGTKVVSTEGRQIRIVDSVGARSLITVDNGVSGLRMEPDGGRVFFLLNRDQNVVRTSGSTPIQRGLYVVNADGTGLRQIVGPAAVAALLGVSANSSISPEFGVASTAANHSLGVSRDGARIVFGAMKVAGRGPDAIFGVNLDGSGLHTIIGPVSSIQHLGINADGTKVLYSLMVSTALLDEIGVVDFDGSARRILRNEGSPSVEDPAGAAVQLSADGSVLLAYDMLYATDGSGVFQISTTSNSLTPGRPVMDAAARRFVYSFVYPGTYSQGLSQLASLEIDPLDLGSAPAISGPAISPGYVIPNDVFKATLTAAVTTLNSVIGVSYAIVEEGRVERPYNGDVFLADDATAGDRTAGDGFYTTNAVRAATTSAVGPRALRLFAQVRDAALRRHATLVDLVPFFVLSQPPAGAAPRINSSSTASGQAGSELTIAGSGFDPLPAKNQVIVGSRLAQILRGSATELTILVPRELVPGLSTLFVAARGLTSNAILFTVR